LQLLLGQTWNKVPRLEIRNHLIQLEEVVLPPLHRKLSRLVVAFDGVENSVIENVSDFSWRSHFNFELDFVQMSLLPLHRVCCFEIEAVLNVIVI